MLRLITAICLVIIAQPALAATPRDLLTEAAFTTRDKPAALHRIAQAEAAVLAILRQKPNDREALLIRAMAVGYRAKLARTRADALSARKMLDALASSDPRYAEAQLAIGGWHIDAVADLGGLVARAALGASKSTGLAAIDRAVALGGNRAMFPGLAALLRLSLDGRDPRARALAEAATRATTPTALDKAMQRSAAAILIPLRAGDPRTTQKLAKQLLPFGRVPR